MATGFKVVLDELGQWKQAVEMHLWDVISQDLTFTLNRLHKG
jgi:hypothetical protein